MTAFAFPGLNLAVTTPFDSEGRVDLDGLEGHLERYIAAGVWTMTLTRPAMIFAPRATSASDSARDR